MKKLSELFKKLWAKFKTFSKGIRIAMVVSVIAVLVAIISLVVYSSSNKYAVLYSNLDPSDVDVVINKLTEDKVDMKVDGNSILVDKNQVDELRLKLASQLSSGSKGYELMDDSSSFGMTDEEFNIRKLRMLQGELEKSIKSLEPVESARVHITPAKSSVFVQDKEPGKAAVILKLKSGTKLSDDQVQSIVSLLSVSTENVPKENFDSKKQTQNIIDPNKVIVSQQTIKEWNNINGGTVSESPVDNNMSNTIEGNTSVGSSGSEEQKTNYDTGKTETVTITAPGEVKRLTASVFIDGKLDEATKGEFEKAIGAAIGFDSNRGDEISLVGMEFDPTIKEEAQAQIDEFNAELAKEKRNKLIMWGAIALGIVTGIIVLIILIKKRKEKVDERVLDVVIDDSIPSKEAISFAPIDFEVKNEKSHIESEIKKYAKDKPDQVVDIIKSWLSENER